MRTKEGKRESVCRIACCSNVVAALHNGHPAACTMREIFYFSPPLLNFAVETLRMAPSYAVKKTAFLKMAGKLCFCTLQYDS